MGYSTDFNGQIMINPPLNEAEIGYLRRFSCSRRMRRTQGPYRANPGDSFGQNDTEGVIDYNQPPTEQPELWCQWVPTEDGWAIEWDGAEKFYSAAEWMAYIIRTFLMPGATVYHEFADPEPGREYPPEFERFTFDHVCDGVIVAQGEDPEDRWDLIVKQNVVTVRRYTLEPGEEVQV